MSSEDDHLKDVIDLLNFASHDYVEEEQEGGEMKSVLKLNPKRLYYSTRLVNSTQLGEAVVKFLGLEKLAKEARYFMTPKRALIAKKDLMARFDNYHYGIDAKSSETVRDKDNNQSSLLHLIRKEHVEKEFKAQDAKSQKLLASWLGNKNPDEA